jgi:outer membrane protein assembly factor BamB
MRRLIAIAVATLMLVAGIGTTLILSQRQQRASPSSTDELRESTSGSSLGTRAWPTYGGSNARTHRAPKTLLPPYRRLWSVYGDSSFIEFPPVIVGEQLFFATDRGRAVAVSTRSGHLLWQRRLGHCVAASPAAAGTKVVFAAMGPPPCDRGQGEVVAVDRSDGRLRWRFLAAPIESSPLVVDGLVIVGDRGGNVYALDLGDGQVRWRFRTGAAVKGGASAAGTRIFIGSYDGHVYALEAATGKLAWRARSPSGGHLYATPSLAHGLLFIGATDGFVMALDSRTGQLRWSRRLPSFVYASAAVAGSRVFIGSYDHRLYALEATTGKPLWSFKGQGPVSGTATVVGKLVFFSTCGSCSTFESNPAARRTYALDASSGKLIWTYPDGEYTPVVTDGLRIYLTGYATITALEPSSAGRRKG